jgi:Domain of unknown function (DUF4136)
MVRSHWHWRGTSIAIAACALMWLAEATWVSAAKTDIKIDFDSKFAFAGLRKWAWHRDGTGDVKMAISSRDDPKRLAARVDPVIVPAVEKELGAKGFSKSQDGVELYAHYYVLATVGTMAQVQGQFVAAVPEWGLPPFTGSTSALSVYPTGTLIIDLTVPDGQIVWRGAAQRKLDLDSSDAERRKVLERAIADLFKNFPPKAKK